MQKTMELRASANANVAHNIPGICTEKLLKFFFCGVPRLRSHWMQLHNYIHGLWTRQNVVLTVRQGFPTFPNTSLQWFNLTLSSLFQHWEQNYPVSCSAQISLAWHAFVGVLSILNPYMVRHSGGSCLIRTNKTKQKTPLSQVNFELGRQINMWEIGVSFWEQFR